MIYSTYLGGSNDERAFSIAVDNAGNAYVAGRTISSDFPVTSTSFDTSFNGGRDAFLTKLNSSGSALLYSTYLGGSSDENDNTGDIAIDNTGNAYLTGYTQSSDFPITTNAYDSSYNGGYDVFVSKINTLFSGTTSLVYSSYIGGSGNDVGRSVAVDSIGNIFITGYASGDFPTTVNAYDTSHNGNIDIFVCKLNSIGSNLIYSTFIGGSNTDDPSGIAIDAAGSAYITGYTRGSIPITLGAFDTTGNGGDDGFFCKLNSDGSALVYSSYLGGNGATTPNGVVVDNNGNAFITGTTAATDFPTTPDALDSTYNGGLYDIFLCKVNASGSALLYSTYLGGSGEDSPSYLTIDNQENVYIVGATASSDFPTTTNAYDTTFNGGSFDLFVSKIGFPPLVEKAIYSDINNNLSVDSGDKVTIQFDKRMKVNSATTAAFYLPVTGDKLGAGATIAVNLFNDTQVVITLGTTAKLTIPGVFSMSTVTSGSPSGIDISSTMPANHIEDLNGLDALPSGVKDIIPAVTADTTWIINTTGGIAQTDTTGYYTEHKVIIPANALSTTSTQITVAPPGENHGQLSAVKFEPPTLTFSTATLVIEYKVPDIREEAGYMESAMRIHQWRDSATCWVLVPETLGLQALNTANRTVNVPIDKFDMVGSGPGFMKSFFAANTMIVYANIDLPTVDAKTGYISPAGGLWNPQGTESFFASNSAILTVGTTYGISLLSNYGLNNSNCFGTSGFIDIL